MARQRISRQLTHKVCSCCGRELPVSQFERYPSGTHRGVCNHCKYQRYSAPAKLRYVLNHLGDDR